MTINIKEVQKYANKIKSKYTKMRHKNKFIIQIRKHFANVYSFEYYNFPPELDIRVLSKYYESLLKRDFKK